MKARRRRSAAVTPLPARPIRDFAEARDRQIAVLAADWGPTKGKPYDSEAALDRMARDRARQAACAALRSRGRG